MSSAIPTMSSTIAASTTSMTYANRASYLAAPVVSVAPPKGVTVNYNDPNSNGDWLIFVNILGVILCTTVTAMRLWTKGILMRTLGWDDYTSAVSLFCVYLWTIARVEIASLGFGVPQYNFHKSNGTVMLKGKFEYIAQAAYLFGIGCVKVSILLMYLRLFTTVNTAFKYTVRVLIFLITGAHLVAFLGWIFSIIPPSCHWNYWPTEAEYETRCHRPKFNHVLVAYSLFLNVFSVSVDLVILYLPIRPVWRLQLSKRQKVSILLILCAGGIVTIASILRLAYYCARNYRPWHEDPWVAEWQVQFITTFELDIAQLCACLPSLKPFFRQYYPSLLRLKTFLSRSKERSTSHSAASSHHLTKMGRKWPGRSRHEEFIGSNYLELGNDGKSDQTYIRVSSTTLIRSSAS